MNTSRNKWRKPLTFGLIAALGCLVAAGLGELWLGATKPPPPPPPPPPAQPQQVVALVLDTSGSMNDGSLDEMKRAAQSYVERQDLNFLQVAVVNFDSGSYLVAPLTRDRQTLINAIGSLSANGMTRMDLGLEQAFSQVQSENVQRNILLFTDGMPAGFLFFDARTPTVQSADKIRSNNVRLVAIASGGADRDFLAQLTGDPNLVFSASQGNFGEAFKQAEQIITPPTKTAQLVESAPTENTDFRSSLLRIAVWTAILGLGLTLPLLLAQKRYTRRPPALEDAIGAVGGVLIGLLAGVFAQSFFALAAGAESGLVIGRIVAWALWGGALGWGLSAFVPNLRADRAVPAGAVGGVLGALGFIVAASSLGDVAGRCIGAAILGFCIGAMIVLAEVAFRRAWLHVSYGPGDAYDMNLGVRPLSVGSDQVQAKILAHEAEPIAMLYAMTETGRVYIEEPETNRRTDVPIGDERKFGNVTITVCGELSEISQAAAAQNIAMPQNTPMPQPYPDSQSAPAAPAYPIPQSAPPMNGWQLWHPQNPLQMGIYGVWTMGRAEDNDFVIGDATVSSRHARLEAQNGMLVVIDIGSSNGTFINGTRLHPNAPAVLNPSDRLQLGQTEFVIQPF